MNPKEQMSAILDEFYNKIANGEEIPDNYERVPEVEKHVFFKLPLRQDKILNPWSTINELNQINQIIINGTGFGNIALAIENKSEQSYFIDIEIGYQCIMSLKLKSGKIEWIFDRYFIPLVGLQYHLVKLHFRLYDPEENESDEAICNRPLVEPNYQNIWVYYADIETGLKNVLTVSKNRFNFPTFIIRFMAGMMGKADIGTFNNPHNVGETSFDPHPDELQQPYYGYVLK